MGKDHLEHKGKLPLSVMVTGCAPDFQSNSDPSDSKESDLEYIEETEEEEEKQEEDEQQETIDNESLATGKYVSGVDPVLPFNEEREESI